MRTEYRTPRLVVRAWRPADAAARKAAVDASLPALRPWFPWAADDPRPVAAHAALLAAYAADFAAGRWWGYGVWALPASGRAAPSRARLVGAAHVYRARQDVARPSTRELSYWLAADATGQGYATEAAGALADAALAEPGVLRLEIRIDPANESSARVPPRLGFFLRERVAGDRTDRDGRPLDTLVWERARRPARLRPATAADVPRLQEIRARVREPCAMRPGVATGVDDITTIERGLCWVWADEGGVQGFASGHPSASNELSNELWALCVDPAAEGQGIGGALLAQLTDVLWALGHRELVLATPAGTRAERLCLAAGWTVAGRVRGGHVQLRRAF